MKNFTKLLFGGGLAGVLLLGSSVETLASPASTELANRSYEFKATKTATDETSGFQDQYDALPAEFTFTLTNYLGTPQINNFFYSYIRTYPYNTTTGEMTLTKSSGGIINGTSYKIYFSESQYGGGTGQDKSATTFIWTISEDGNSITIPDFYVHDYESDALIAEYTNIQCAVPGYNSWQNPDITDTTEIGTYDWSVIPTDLNAGTETAPEEIQVKVLKDNTNETTYYIQETGDTNIFGGYIVTATYNDATSMLTIEQKYAGKQMGQMLWFSPWIANSTPVTEPQGQILIGFDATKGFTFKSSLSDGFGWFVSESDSAFEITGEASNLFYLPISPVEISISNPEAEVDGYTVTVTVDAELIGIEEDEIDSITGKFTPTSGEAVTATGTYADGVITFVLENVEAGEYEYELTVTLFDEAEEELATSEPVNVEFTVVLIPALEISNAEATVDGKNVTVTVDAELTAIEEDEIGSIKGIFAPQDGESVSATGTYANGVITFELTDLTPAEYEYELTVTLYDEEDSEIVVSNSVEVSFEIELNPEITISNAEVSVTEEKVTITFDVELSDCEPASYEANLTLEGEITTVTASVENGVATIILTGLQPQTEYNYSIELVGFDEEDEVLATSNALEVTVKDIPTGVSSLNAEEGNVRYFNLQGVEIARPDNGIVIRVQNGKTEKVVIR